MHASVCKGSGLVDLFAKSVLYKFRQDIFLSEKALLKSIVLFQETEVTEIVPKDKAEKYREKDLASIQELIQTEKNYIENLKSIYSFNKYMEESKVKTDNDAIHEGRMFTVMELLA